MKRRNARKAISLGRPASFDWHLRDTSQDGEEETLASIHSKRRRGKRSFATYVLTLVFASVLVGVYLFQRAESNLARVEAEVAQALVQENVQRQARAMASATRTPTTDVFSSDAHSSASITLLELHEDFALVDMVVSQPTEAWHTGPYRVARLLRQGAVGWYPITTVDTFWSERRSLSTTYFQIDYSRRDEAAITEIAPELDDLYLRLYSDLGLTPPSWQERLQLRIAPVAGSEVRVTDLRYSGGVLIIPPPELIARPPQLSHAETLRQAIAYPLAVRVYAVAREEYPVPCQWSALHEGIGLWLRWEDHTLPSRRHWEYESAIKEWSSPNRLPRLDDLRTNSTNCSLQPSILEMEIRNSGEPLPRSELASVFVEYLVATHGRRSVPQLLRNMDRFSSWAPLARANFDLSAAELEAEWRAYLIARKP